MNYLQRGRTGVADWLEAIRHKADGYGRWPYHAAMDVPWALQASAIALHMAGDLAGGPDSLSPEQRDEAVRFLQSCQDPETGWFKDPHETPDRYTGRHTWRQVWAQRTGSTVSTLDWLGAAPLYDPPAAEYPDLDLIDGRDFTLNHIDWSEPWRNGETWTRTLRSYLQSRRPDAASADPPATVIHAYDALESEVLNPATGTPSRRMTTPDPAVAMAALFKVLNGYGVTGRAFPYPRQGIDSTLALQHDDGDWGHGDDMTMVWDALYVLRELDRRLDGSYRFDEIRAAGQRTAEFLLEVHRKPDGGFSFHRDRCLCNHASIRLCDADHAVGDVLGTWMTLMCLEYADEWAARPHPPRGR